MGIRHGVSLTVAVVCGLFLAVALPLSADAQAPRWRGEAVPGLDELATKAYSYQGELVRRQRGRVDEVAAAKAVEAARADMAKNRWYDVVRHLETAIGLGLNDPALWLELARANARRSPGSVNTMRSAMVAFQLLPNAVARAEALVIMGRGLVSQDRNVEAAALLARSLAMVDDPEIRSEWEVLVGKRLVLAKVNVDSDQDVPELCLEFSWPLHEDRSVRYEDFLSVEPPVQAGIAVKGKSMCLTGFSHGGSYELTLRQGMRGTGEALLKDGAVEQIDVPDRPARVAFRGFTYILPRIGAAGVPLASVNVETAKLRLLRIGDRNLVHELRNGNIMNGLSVYDASEIAQDKGELVWEGVVDIESRKNREVTTAVPLPDGVTLKPGIHVLLAEPIAPRPESYEVRTTQWLVVTDIGLSSFSGTDGMEVFARSYANAAPLAGVALRLYGRSNELLGEARTDAAGRARFAPGLLRGESGQSPAAVMAFTDSGEFTFLDLTQPGFDLTDRGVGGRPAPGPMDAFIYSDRGIYRPGETAHVVALLRDGAANGIAGPPLTLKLLRPDGVEVRRLVTQGNSAGGHYVAIPFSDGARTGVWSVTAHIDPKAAPVGRLRLQVEDFVPARLEVTLKPEGSAITTRAPLPVVLRADYLYGAPGAGLATEAEMILRRATTPFEAFKDYRFGLVQEDFTQVRVELTPPATDAQGQARFELELDKYPDTTHPLEALVQTAVFEPGGRPANRTAIIPVRGTRPLIGVRSLFEGSVGEAKPAEFDIVALSPDGERIALPNMRYSLVREDRRYTWYEEDGSWRYRSRVRDTQVANGELAVTAGAPARLSRSLRDGEYRLETYDVASGAVTSVRFSVGWTGGNASADTPDTLRVSVEAEKIGVGGTARLRLDPPFAGTALVAVASDRLIETREVAVPTGGTVVELPVTEAWGPGAYVTATLFRPGEQARERGPGRAIGLAWIAVDTAPRTLGVSIEAPAMVRPRQTVTVPVRVANLAAGEETFLTVAAVDEGILTLTDFETPKPDAWYYGKRRLGVEMRDAYGRLIDTTADHVGRLRSGGDAAGRHTKGLPDKNVEVVALFHGPVTVGGGGLVEVPLAIPDFNGRLRVMAVAYSRTRVGHGEAPLVVRDPVVLSASMPRFLAPGDEATMTLTLNNVDGPEQGQWRIELAGEGAVGIRQGDESTTLSVPRGQEVAFRPSVAGLTLGSGRVNLTLTAPDGTQRGRSWAMSVRPMQSYVTRRVARVFQPGAGARLSDSDLNQYMEGTVSVAASFSSVPNLDLPGLLKSLDRYPYGCLEQTTSRALPLLYVSDIAEKIGIVGKEQPVRARVQTAIGRIVSMQRADGGFGLWDDQSEVEAWLSAYAMDFLVRAKEKGLFVADFALERGLRWLKDSVSSGSFSDEQLPAAAYAFYVLSRGRAVDRGALRYFHDVYGKTLPNRLAKSQVAAALALIGDTSRAAQAFSDAAEGELVLASTREWSWRDYGSNLRDAAAFVALGLETGMESERAITMAQRMAELKGSQRYLSTQEQGWLTLAAHALITKQEDMILAVGDQKIGPTRELVALNVPAEQLRDGFSVRNDGPSPIYGAVSLSGIPIATLPAESNGFTIERSYHTLDGRKITAPAVRQNDMVVVVIKGKATTNLNHQALIVDLLPAGFELENFRLSEGRSTSSYAWLKDLSAPQFVELRDDRYVAALDITGSKREFTLAYLLRAVTPGVYGQPAVFVEDMYKPQYNARTDVNQIRVAPVQ